MDEFLANLENPVTDSGCAIEFDATLSGEEICFSIKAMQSHKAPGPDGFPVKFLKKFIDKLAPLLLLMFNESLENAVLPLKFKLQLRFF